MSTELWAWEPAAAGSRCQPVSNGECVEQDIRAEIRPVSTIRTRKHTHTGARTHTQPHAQLLLVCQGHVARPSLSAVWLPSGPCAGLLCVTFRQSRSDVTCSPTWCLLSGIWWDHLLRLRNHAKLASAQWLPLKECQENDTLCKCLRFNLSDRLDVKRSSCAALLPIGIKNK